MKQQRMVAVPIILANYLGQTNSGWNYAMNNPGKTGVVVGVAAGAVAYGGAALATNASITYLNGAGTACIALCGSVGQQSAQYGQTLSSVASNPTLKNIVNNTYQASDKLPGGTFGAVQNELVTGMRTGGSMHFTKMMDSLNGLGNLLTNANLTRGDLGVISTLINNASNAVSTAAKLIK